VAWSGRGTIPRVDVTIDGGITWHAARMSGPSFNKSMHRFYYDFDWDGKPMLLQSRAHDSTGYVQPTKNQLRDIRGENSIYHNNSIQTWSVNEQGVAENVEIS
jgi:sulfane dehydrogenase subunit SoxC